MLFFSLPSFSLLRVRMLAFKQGREGKGVVLLTVKKTRCSLPLPFDVGWLVGRRKGRAVEEGYAYVCRVKGKPSEVFLPSALFIEGYSQPFSCVFVGVYFIFLTCL